MIQSMLYIFSQNNSRIAQCSFRSIDDFQQTIFKVEKCLCIRFVYRSLACSSIRKHCSNILKLLPTSHFKKPED